MELDRIQGGAKPSPFKSLRMKIILNLFTGIILNGIPEAHAEQALQTAKAVEETAPNRGVPARLDHTASRALNRAGRTAKGT